MSTVKCQFMLLIHNYTPIVRLMTSIVCLQIVNSPSLDVNSLPLDYGFGRIVIFSYSAGSGKLVIFKTGYPAGYNRIMHFFPEKKKEEKNCQI